MHGVERGQRAQPGQNLSQGDWFDADKRHGTHSLFQHRAAPDGKASDGAPYHERFDSGLNRGRGEAPPPCKIGHGLPGIADRFQSGFPGLMGYAIKANPAPEIPKALAQARMRAFDEASPVEMDLLCAHLPGTALHYHKPVRLRVEFAVGSGRLGPATGSVSWKAWPICRRAAKIRCG